MNVAQRLELLLPWINGEDIASDWLRNHHLWTFLFAKGPASDLWRATTGHTYVSHRVILQLTQLSDSELDQLRFVLQGVLAAQSTGVLQSLRFKIVMRGDILDGAVRAKRAAESPGAAYAVLVDGDLKDILPYVLLRTLTGPGGASVAQCQAPSPSQAQDIVGHWMVDVGGGVSRPVCSRWFVRSSGSAGRPREFCSGACRVREARRRERVADEEAERRLQAEIRSVKKRR